MRSYSVNKKTLEKYNDCRLRYQLSDEEDPYWDLNRRNYKRIKEVLESVGIWFEVEGNELSIGISPEKYIEKKERNAGRSQKVIMKKESDSSDYYRYSDIVYLMQKKKDQDVADEIGVGIATYYRHKKAMKESLYYKSLDLNRLNDKDYLESVSGNFGF